jgi:hypothetical protein
MMVIFPVLFWLAFTLVPNASPDGWKQLAQGIEIQYLTAKKPSTTGDSRITAVRIDPEQWELVFAGVNQPDEKSAYTAKEWCETHKLTAAINAGMFADNYRTHTGYLKFRDHINNSHINSYKSVMAFDPKKGKDVPSFRIFDLDASGVTIQSILNDYNSAIQNLRLIKKSGINVWQQQDREWSEAAIGEDAEGRILFIFSRSSFSMYDFNKELLQSGIGIVAAQHLEGGPEAQFYLKINDFEIDLCGSYETSYNEDDSNSLAFPIPNIIGIRPGK